MIIILTKEDKRRDLPSSNDLHNFNIRTEVLYQADLILYFDDYNPNGLVLKDRRSPGQRQPYLRR